MLTFALLGVWVVLYIPIVVFYDIFSYERGLLITFGMSTMAPIQTYIFTIWVLNQANQTKQTYKNKTICSCCNINNNKSKDAWYTNPLSFSEILSHKIGFEMFTNHLVLEYAVENMLFLLEIEMMKDEILKYKYYIHYFIVYMLYLSIIVK